jgi:hypothetical protein
VTDPQALKKRAPSASRTGPHDGRMQVLGAPEVHPTPELDNLDAGSRVGSRDAPADGFHSLDRRVGMLLRAGQNGPRRRHDDLCRTRVRRTRAARM